MSHNSTFPASILEIDLAKRIIEQHGGTFELYDKVTPVTLYGENTAQGIAKFHLPGWRYPCVITQKGELIYDHFGSRAETMDTLRSVMQTYNDELIMGAVAQQAQNENIHYYREEMPNGDIQLVINY